MTDWTQHRTERLTLTTPTLDDVDAWHELHADPRVWTHFPSGRATDRSESVAAVVAARDDWDRADLGYWVIRSAGDGAMVGVGGCRPVGDGDRWNLYYRFTPESQGNGFAAEVARAAVEAANAMRPDWPVVAIMLEHNVASWKVAERIGLQRIATGPDEGNPDPTAVRFTYADRPLDQSR